MRFLWPAVMVCRGRSRLLGNSASQSASCSDCTMIGRGLPWPSFDHALMQPLVSLVLLCTFSQNLDAPGAVRGELGNLPESVDHRDPRPRNADSRTSG